MMPDWQNEPCTKEQREYLDGLSERKWISYQELLQMAMEITSTTVGDVGELTKGQASELLEVLKER